MRSKTFLARRGFLGLVLSIFLAGCSSSDESPGFLKHRVVDPAPNAGSDCCTDVLMLGDVDNDGNLDIVIGSEKAEGAGLVWYRYPTWEKYSIAYGEFTTDGQLADLNGDGKLDVSIGASYKGKGNIFWYENIHATERDGWIRHDVGEGYAHDLVVGDMNGDGKSDIVTCDKKQVVLWEQVSPDSWREHIVAERAGEGIALSDIDGDGDIDVVYGGAWIENPGTLTMTPWKSYSIAPAWSADTRAFVADMNKDGRPDVLLTVSEGDGALSWFESPGNPWTGTWVEHHVEQGILEGAHSLQVADIDGDGELDVITAEMHTSRKKRVLVYFARRGFFEPLLLSRNGSHNMRVGDIDSDGDIDLVGKNYAGTDRVVEMWENLTSKKETWEYLSIDHTRPKSQDGKMGLLFVDADRDGFTDVVAGSFLYLNPGGVLQAAWKRVALLDNIDIYFAADVDGDRLPDLIGIKGETVIWIEATDEKAASWKSVTVGKVAKGRTQGYVKAQLVPGSKPQLIFTHGNNLYVLEVPDDPEQVPWPLHHISTENEEAGVALGDIDRDGDLDIAAVRGGGHEAVWFENPGSLVARWKMWVAGKQSDSNQAQLDRVALADLDGDGNLEMVATEERQDWRLAAHLYWFKAPVDPKAGEWRRHSLGRHRSLNSLDVADVDGDGRIDIVVAEHTDQTDQWARDNLTTIYSKSSDERSWTPRVVERGPHSSHLGARLVDLNNDGFLEIVSIGWGQYKDIHLWEKVTQRQEL